MKESSQNSGINNNEKAFRCWSKLMQLGEKTGCHQLPERSFFIHGYQLPVCARCSGVILGYILAIPFFIRTGFHAVLSIAGCLIMLLDWLLQAAGIIKSENRRRLFTGVLGGFGIMSIELYIIRGIFKFIKGKR